MELNNAYTSFNNIQSSQQTLTNNVNQVFDKIHLAINDSTNNVQILQIRLDKLIAKLNSKMSELTTNQLSNFDANTNTISELCNVCQANYQATASNSSQLSTISKEIERISKYLSEDGELHKILKKNSTASGQATVNSSKNSTRIDILEQKILMLENVNRTLLKQYNDLKEQTFKTEAFENWKQTIEDKSTSLYDCQC